MKKYFSAIKAKNKVEFFLSKQVGLCRHNLVNQEWHKNNPAAMLKLLGFKSYEETIICAKAFFTKMKIQYPSIEVKNKKIIIKPEKLTNLEEILLAKMLM